LKVSTEHDIKLIVFGQMFCLTWQWGWSQRTVKIVHCAVHAQCTTANRLYVF